VRKKRLSRTCAELVLAASIIFLLAIVLFPELLAAQSGSSGSNGSKGQGSSNGGNAGGNSKGQGGQSTGGQGGGGQQGTTASNSYRVEIDMLAYDAAEKIADHIRSQINGTGTKFIVYDEQTFVNLQTYQAFEAGISSFESAYTLLGLNKGKSLEAGVAAAQTIVSTLAALRSSTEFATQPVNLNTDALVAQLASKLPGKVVVPRIILENPLEVDDLGLDSWDVNKNTGGCADVQKSVPWQLACVLAKRNEVIGAPGFSEIDKLFLSFLGTVLNISASGSVTGSSKANVSGSGEDKKGSADSKDGSSTTPTDKANQPAQNNAANQSFIPPPALFSLVSGRRLEYELRETCPSKSSGSAEGSGGATGNAPTTTNTQQKKSTPSSPGSTHLLLVETTAAGGSYRIRHNFWVELFWTTPTPSFNGGAVVTYYLINPCDSAVEKSEVLRYMIDYGKFKDIKPEEHGSNFQ